MYKVGIIGAAGFAGIEAARIMLGHPGFELVYATSDSDAGKPLAQVYPGLAGVTGLCFQTCDVAAIAEQCELVFLAVPHTASLGLTPALLEAGMTVIDLSADYRLKDSVVYEQWYNAPHTSASLLKKAVYGLPEFDRAGLVALQDAEDKLVACAGCYPTASTLAAMPALQAGIVSSRKVISDCLSGVSGAGRKLAPTSSFCSAANSVCAYGVVSHRHTPEIAQTLSSIAGQEVQMVFTPHLVPMVRGLLATVYLDIEAAVGCAEVRALYESFYADEPFVTVLPEGKMPQTAHVAGTNRAQIGLAVDEASHTLIVSSAIDNLVKGAAGQAVQCANIVTGQDEQAGLVTMLPPVV